MELKELMGLHKLSGVDITNPDECGVVRFVLDGITYKAVEDPSDGYRSYCNELIVCNESITNNFHPQEVIGKMKDNDVIQFIDVVTGKIVLEVGTDNLDGYYPYCIMNWNPENLAINVGR